MGWREFVNTHAGNLRAGALVALPEGMPLEGWKRLRWAEAAGQVADLAFPCADGSRLHVHIFADGRRLMHRDRWDPERGPVAAVLHWLVETRSGRGAVLLGALATKLLRGKPTK